MLRCLFLGSRPSLIAAGAKLDRSYRKDLYYIFSTKIDDAYDVLSNGHLLILIFYGAVEFARLLFPAEARLAMEIAHADKIPEFTDLPLSSSASKSSDALQNETPSLQNKRLRSRVDALTKTGNLFN